MLYRRKRVLRPSPGHRKSLWVPDCHLRSRHFHVRDFHYSLKERPPNSSDLYNQRISAGKGNALLRLFLGRSCGLGRKLKYRCFLTVAEHGQQDDAPIRKFERIMMHPRLFLVDLAKDCQCLTDGQFSRREHSSRRQYYLLGEGKLRSRQKADGRPGIVGCGKSTGASPEVVRRKLVANFCGARPSELPSGGVFALILHNHPRSVCRTRIVEELLMSAFVWLDYSEHERRKMLDIVDLFREHDTRDELGIGSVRDTFADLFFPGTTTIMTRARYFLLVPWTYQRLEKQRVCSAQIAERARRAEADLVEAIERSDDSDGNIGKVARTALKRLPSSVYWQGLGVWGIRNFRGAQAQYHRSLDRHYVQLTRHDGRVSERDVEHDDLVTPNWHAGLISSPSYFPGECSLRLTRREAEYARRSPRPSEPSRMPSTADGVEPT